MPRPYVATVVSRPRFTRAYVPGSYKRATLRGPLARRVYAHRRARHSDIVGRGMSLEQKLKSVVENKYVDGSTPEATSLQSVDGSDATWASCELPFTQATATYGSLPLPRQGTNYGDRDGRKIFVKWIHLRATLTWDGVNGATVPSDIGPARIIIVKDTRTNGVQLSAENVIGPGLGSDGNAVEANDCAIGLPTNPDGWGRYKILKDKTYNPPTMQNYYDGASAQDRFSLKRVIKMKVKVNDYINFSDSTGAIGSVIDNSFHVIGAFAGTVNVQFSGYSRVAFVG